MMTLITSKIAMAKDLGMHGNLFGGNMLSWIDEAAATLASRVCQTASLVTLKMEEVVFKKAVKQGFQILIYGEVTRIGNTSITLLIEARKHNVYTGEENVVCSTNITFVHIDEQGSAIPISPYVRKKWENGEI
jgi:acyl-CoA thioesterase YciA